MLRRTSGAWVKAASPNAACQLAASYSKKKTATSTLMEKENNFAAHNYKPLPVVFERANGVLVTDPEGREYYDFLSGYGAVSTGHVHKSIIKVATQQMAKCTLSSRAFHSSNFGHFSEFVTQYFGFDKVLAMNSGAEAVETALKIARKWAYRVKKVPANEAIIVCCKGNFHGRTLAMVSLSDDPDSFGDYGPFLPGIVKIPFGDIEALDAEFQKNGSKIAGFLVEPIQGEAGVIIPPRGYLNDVRKLCTKHNILFLADEVQCGIARTGKMLAVDHENVRPDILILAKALGGGVVPISCVLADNDIMNVLTPGTHGSTFGGNPLAAAIAMESLKVIHEKKLVVNSAERGVQLLDGLKKLHHQYPHLLTEVRGRGLFAAMDFNKTLLEGKAGYKYMHIMKDLGLLAKITHDHTLRLSPPLVITSGQLRACLKKLDQGLKQLEEVVIQIDVKKNS